MNGRKVTRKFIIIAILSIVVVFIPKNTWAVTGSDVVNIAKGEVGQVTGSPNKYTYWNGSISGSYSYAWCHAFVSWCGAQAGASNIIPKTASCAEGYKYFVSKGQWKSRSSGYVPKSGDIIYFDYGSNGTYDHVGIVDYVSSGRVHTIEGNASNAVKKDGGYSNGYSLSNTDILGYGIPAYDNGNNPQGMIDSYSGGVQKISIAGWAFDADQPNTALEIHAYIGTKCVGTCIANKERPDVNNVYGVGNNHGFDATFSVSESGENLVKIYAINVGGGENTLLQSIKINIIKDTEKPTISNVQVTNHSKNGYTITCDVSDNVGISKVLFPTWNDSEGTASAKWLKGTVSGGKATVRVNVSDWDNKEGIYYTDIYTSDKSGNESCYSRITRYIDRTPPTISEVKVTSMDVDGYTVSCKVTDNKTMSRVQFPTWTRENDQDDLNPAWETDSKASGTKNGDYYTYRVNISDHNKEKGPYVTHIYAYDMSGNSTKCESLEDVKVPNYGISEGQNATVSKETFRISGWVTDTRGISKITYKINGGTENDFSLEQKTGVVFTAQINTTNSKAGSNTVDITVYPKTGNTYNLPALKVTVNIQPFEGEIEAPETDTINSGDSITVKGWAICGASIAKNTVYIDGKEMGQLAQVARTDVAEKYPNCTNMKGKEGYSGTINIGSLADGKHTLKVVSTTNNNANYEKSIVFYKTGEKFAEANFTAVIKNAGSGKVLTVRESDNNVLSNSASGTPAQTWKFIKKTSTSYAIQNTATGKYLYSTGKSGDNVAVKDASGDTIPKWELYKAKSGGYYLKPMASASGMLDLTDASTAENANIRIYQYNAGNSQRFTLEYQVESVTLNKTTVALTEMGQTEQLTASVLPNQANDKTVTWTSSDASVATVNSSGLVTAVGNGTATITVKTNSSAKTAVCKVTVDIPTAVAKGEITAGSVAGKPGQTVEVPITLTKNPGIVAVQFKLQYDSSKLQLIEIKDTGLLESPQMSDNYTANPYILAWGDGMLENNITQTGNVAVVCFKVLDSVSGNSIPIELIPDSACDKDGNDVEFRTINGKITFSSIPGDVNNDGKVKLNDAILLRRYVAGWNVTVNLEAADVNDDGKVKLNDAILLRRYVAGWNVTIK